MAGFEDAYRLDRTQLSVGTHDETERETREFWRRQTPEARWRAAEYLRQIHYGYDPATARLQRVLEVVDLGDL